MAAVTVWVPRQAAPGRLPPPARCSRRETPATYRRRRATVALCLAAAVGVPSWAALRPVAGLPAGGAAPPSRGRVYVARPGDTLWGIATRLDPGGDPRPLVDQMEAELHGGQLQAGQRLILPGTTPG